MPLLELTRRRGALRRRPRAARRLADGRRGRGRRRPRRERRREDDDAARDLRDRPARGRRSVFAGRPIGRTPGVGRARRDRARARRAAGTFAELTVHENLRLGAYTQRERRRRRARTRSSRSSRRAPAAGGRTALRRRAADARRRAGADAAAAAAAPRRAVARARAARRPRALRDRPAPERGGRARRAARRAERRSSRSTTAARAYVLEAGRVAVEGPSDELREDEAVRRSVPGVLDGATSCSRSSAGSPRAGSTRASRSRSCSSTARRT